MQATRLALLTAAVAVGALASLVPAASAAPANDNFASAEALAGDSGTVAGTNVDATTELGEPFHAGAIGGASVWFRWTAPFSGKVLIDTCRSSFDTLLSVYTGSAIGQATLVAASDDDCEDVRSRARFAAQAGTTYRIAVDGFRGAA